MSMRYVPGGAVVAVTAHGFAVFEAQVQAEVVARVHALLAAGRGLAGVLEALTAAYGASLTELPPFAVALSDGAGARLAVRGDLPLHVDAAVAETVTGAGVMTWSERSIAAVDGVTFGAEGTDAASALPIADGVVLADWVQWRATAAPAVAPAPSAVAEPVEAPPADLPPVVEPVEVPVAPVAEPVEVPVAPVAALPPVAEPVEVPAPTPQRLTTDPIPVDDASDLVDYTVPSVRRRPDEREAFDADDAGVDEATLIPVDDDTTGIGAAPGFDEQWEATVIRDADAPATGAVTAVEADGYGDHDGHTVSVAQIRAMRAAPDASAPSPVDSMPPLAAPRRPAPGRLRVSTGQVVTLDRTVVVGRRPRSTRVSGTDLPHLVAVDSPQQDISRSHLELRVEGDSIVATDLRTTNGTTLHRPGSDPVRLHPGEGTVVVAGDLLDLGDGITVTVEEMA
ncbi:hypothetical protein JOD63_002576 [Microbacterium terrae]|uniref:FHA domain protein n=1 Tax=Microbacterium terrae TaxID=69369 RepID=A0A0M2HDA5_9MICO|nr:FHA domain-containing protein [Microbacterium terrae]KJL42679.1 FHA domain protein [Microbacterium terrae]MBP1078608.1 hypothetical protein [Microbacterium terrae]GLJ98009.1 hypothetical protein GCM10017594_12060 [Microbacterium terrae]